MKKIEIILNKSTKSQIIKVQIFPVKKNKILKKFVKMINENIEELSKSCNI